MLEFSPFAYEMHEDPYPTYKRLRDEAPAYYNSELDFWALSRFEDVLEAMHDWQTYSSAEGVSLEKGSASTPPMIISMDPPRQAKLRRLVSQVFTPRRVAELEPQIRSMTCAYLEPLTKRGGFELIEDFAGKLPMDVISVMLGVPAEDRDTVRGWADALLHREAGRAEIPEEGRRGAANLYRYFASKVGERRSRPGEDMISALVSAEIDGERLADPEIVGFCFLLAIAGNETTTKMIGNAIYHLWRHPEQRAALVADPGLVPGAVEEVLRYDNSTQMLARVMTRDVEKHGVTMPKGTKLLLLIGAANRDDREFQRPEEFDIRRRVERHLGFGFGTHVCLGASLARLEGKVALEEIHARFPTYQVDASGLERVHSANVRGYSKVPIRL